jgi:hypothetical protein
VVSIAAGLLALWTAVADAQPASTPPQAGPPDDLETRSVQVKF